MPGYDDLSMPFVSPEMDKRIEDALLQYISRIFISVVPENRRPINIDKIIKSQKDPQVVIILLNSILTELTSKVRYLESKVAALEHLEYKSKE